MLFQRTIELKEKEKITKYQDLARELKKQWNMKVRMIPIIVGAFGKVLKSRGKETGGTGDQRKDQHHSDHCTVKTS